MNKYDIPVISFKTDEGKYMNVVPKEYDGQYSKAMAEAEQVKKIVTAEMENVVQLKVPLLAEAKSGASWYEAK